MRSVFFLVVLLHATPGFSATVAPFLPTDVAPDGVITADSYVEVLSALLSSYRDISGPAPIPLPTTFSHGMALVAYGAIFAWLLPRRRRYAARAAVAMSRIRCTMARRPFDRWEDR